MDPDRLEEFIANEYPRVVAAVTLVCSDASAAEDAVQEALARACERSGRLPEIDNLAAWVTTVACNHTRTGFRRRTRERAALLRLGVTTPRSEPDSIDDVVSVHRAITLLPRRQRHAIVLRYFLGLDVAEVARELGIADGTAKALLYQGRKRLEVHLAELQPFVAPSEARPAGQQHPAPSLRTGLDVTAGLPTDGSTDGSANGPPSCPPITEVSP